MHAVRVIVETRDASIEYVVHVRNRSRHALDGARRAAWRRYPAARAVTAEFTHHKCETCTRQHSVPPSRRVFNRVARNAAS